MKNFLNISLLAFIILCLVSCVIIKTTSYTDPDFKGNKYKKFCVYSLEDNFNERKIIEKEIAVKLRSERITASEGSLIFPPTRDWDEADFQDKLLEEGYDAFLKIEIINEKVDRIVTPTSSTETTTSTEKDDEGNESTTTSTETSYSQSTKLVRHYNFSAILIDIRTNKTAWKGFSNTTYNLTWGKGFETEVSKLAESIVEELKNKKHLQL